MSTWVRFLVSFLFVTLYLMEFGSCVTKTKDRSDNEASQFLKHIERQVLYSIDQHVIGDSLRIPRSMKDGDVRYVSGITDWTVGFYPGILWQAFDLTGAEPINVAAQKYTQSLSGLQYVTGTHDLGFMVNSSFGEAYQRNGGEEAKDIMIKAADHLAVRFDPDVGCIKSWDFGESQGWEFPVIIDNMMNLELLYKATQMTGDSSYHQIAVTHANTTMTHHYRNDYSAVHVVDYDPETGVVRNKVTHQGYADESVWSRGQAWGLYGYVMSFRYTNDPQYLDHAEHIAQFLLDHPKMPKDLIPYWDLSDPDMPHTLRDASAAAIMASALYELFHHKSETKYRDVAEKILSALRSNEYLIPFGESGGFLIDHSVGHKPAGSEVDTPINYADYYFLEAIRRQRGMEIY